MGPFGAANALRITAGTPDEIDFLREALDAVVPAEAAQHYGVASS
jgi:hypothetical protein